MSGYLNRHTHCIICGQYLELQDGESCDYICPACNSSFPGSYILYRINCYNKGIHKREFDILEERLDKSDDVNYASEGYWPEIGITFNWDDEDEEDENELS